MKISKKIGALAAALVMSALLTVSLVGCSGSGQDGNNDFMEKGDGEHLVCAVTGKLIKIAPAILADQLGYFEEETIASIRHIQVVKCKVSLLD